MSAVKFRVTAAAIFFLSLFLFGAAAANAEEILYALTTDNILVRYSTDHPDHVEAAVPIAGLNPGESMIGLDYRPCLCGLYGFTSANRVFEIDPASGNLVVIGGPVPNITGSGMTVDFNPVTEALRVISLEGHSYAIGGNLNPNEPPTHADFGGSYPTLAYAAGDSAAGAAPQIGGVAYNTNLQTTAATTLFGIDVARGTLVRIENGESLPADATSTPVTTVGSLGVPVAAVEGFDITSTQGERAYAILLLAGESQPKLFSINLGNGQASLVGVLGGGFQFKDMAIALAGALRFSAKSYAISEDAGSITVTVSRVGSTVNDVSAQYQTIAQTASAADFTPVNGTITFDSGSSTATITVPITADKVTEGPESFAIALSNPQGGVVLEEPATVLINDPGSGTQSGGGTILAKVTTKTTKILARDLHSRGLRLKVSCLTACTVTNEIVAPKKYARKLHVSSKPETFIARRTSSLKTPSSKTITVKLSRRAQRGILSLPNFRVTVRTTATDGFGDSDVVNQTVAVYAHSLPKSRHSSRRRR